MFLITANACAKQREGERKLFVLIYFYFLEQKRKDFADIVNIRRTFVLLLSRHYV